MKRFKIDSTVIVLGILVLVIVIGAILVSTVGRSFFSPGSIRDILTGMSVLGLVAIGQTPPSNAPTATCGSRSWGSWCSSRHPSRCTWWARGRSAR